MPARIHFYEVAVLRAVKKKYTIWTTIKVLPLAGPSPLARIETYRMMYTVSAYIHGRTIFVRSTLELTWWFRVFGA